MADFLRARAREAFEYEKQRRERLELRGQIGAGFTIPLVAGALFYLASRCTADWSKLGVLGGIEVALLALSLAAAAVMTRYLYHAGLSAPAYRKLTAPQSWYERMWSSMDEVEDELSAQLLAATAENRALNLAREESWVRFLGWGAVATGLVVASAILDLIRSIG